MCVRTARMNVAQASAGTCGEAAKEEVKERKYEIVGEGEDPGHGRWIEGEVAGIRPSGHRGEPSMDGRRAGSRPV